MQLGDKRVYLSLQLSTHAPSLREVQLGTWRQAETKQKPWSAAYWLASQGLLSRGTLSMAG